MADMSNTAPQTSQESNPSVVDNASTSKAPAVRFASTTEEISTDDPAINPVVSEKTREDGHSMTPGDVEQLKEFTKSLHGEPLQQKRMGTYQFEPFSLPPSRVREIPSLL